MSSRNHSSSTRKGRSRRPRVSAGTSQIVQQLKQLNVSNAQQTTRPPPDELDVPRMILKRQKVYSFSESYIGATINYVLGTNNGGSFSFTFSNLANATTYAAIFDQYRILFAEIDFYPAISLNTPNVGGAFPPLYTAIDYDGAVSPLVADIIQYGNKQVTPLGVFVQRTLYPKFLLTVTAGSVAEALGERDMWLDMANLAVPYFGLLWAVGPGPASNVGWTTTVRLVFQCKNTR